MIIERIICNCCGNDITQAINNGSNHIKTNHIVHFPNESFRLDYCDEYCENKYQNKCEHNLGETIGVESFCYDCGKTISHPDL